MCFREFSNYFSIQRTRFGSRWRFVVVVSLALLACAMSLDRFRSSVLSLLSLSLSLSLSLLSFGCWLFYHTIGDTKKCSFLLK